MAKVPLRTAMMCVQSAFTRHLGVSASISCCWQTRARAILLWRLKISPGAFSEFVMLHFVRACTLMLLCQQLAVHFRHA